MRAELEQQNAQIQGELAQIRQQLLEKESMLAQRDAFLEQLKEALILARNHKFAATAESLRSLQSEIFNEPEQDADGVASKSAESVVSDDETDTITVPAHQRRRGGRKPLP